MTTGGSTVTQNAHLIPPAVLNANTNVSSGKNELVIFSIIAVVIVLQLFIYFVPIQRLVMKCCSKQLTGNIYVFKESRKTYLTSSSLLFIHIQMIKEKKETLNEEVVNTPAAMIKVVGRMSQVAKQHCEVIREVARHCDKIKHHTHLQIVYFQKCNTALLHYTADLDVVFEINGDHQKPWITMSTFVKQISTTSKSLFKKKEIQFLKIFFL